MRLTQKELFHQVVQVFVDEALGFTFDMTILKMNKKQRIAIHV